MKTKEEIQAEIDNPHTKALIVMPAANNAYLLNKITLEFPEEIQSVIDDESITLKGKMDIIKRKALVGMMLFVADDDAEMASQIDDFVALLQESKGKKLDYFAPEFVQNQFFGGRLNQQFDEQ